MAWRAQVAGLRIAEVPIRFEEREAGDSKMSTGIAIEAVRLATRWGWEKRVRRKRWARASVAIPTGNRGMTEEQGQEKKKDPNPPFVLRVWSCSLSHARHGMMRQ